MSELFPTDDTGKALAGINDSLRNNLILAHFLSSLGVEANYKTGKFKINAYIPATYHFSNLQNNISTNISHKYNKLFFEPYVKLQYIINQHIELNANYSAYNHTNSIEELYNGFILRSYRNINRFESNFFDVNSSNYSVGFVYKNIFKMLFLNGSISHNYLKSNVISTQNFQNNLMLVSFVEKPNTDNTTFFTGKISKGFDWIRFTADFGILYMLNSRQQIRQNNLVNAESRLTDIALKMSAVPVSFLIVSYNAGFQKNMFFIANEQFAPISSFSNDINLDFSLTKNLRLNTHFEHYFNSTANKKIYFGDFSVIYIWKKLRFDLTCNNIFNTKTYASAYYNDLNEYRYNYTIRPINIVLNVIKFLK